MNEVWIALIVSVLAPSVLVLLNWWLNRKNRLEEEKRQDARDLRVAEVAVKAAEVGAELVKNTEAVREGAEATGHKLDDLAEVTDKVHILVNQKLTNVTQRALDAHVGWLASLEETGAPVEQITRVRASIAELRDDLVDRAVRQAEVDKKDTTQ